MFETSESIAAVDRMHAQTCRAQRQLLSLIEEVDRKEAWRDSGARDTAHWLGMRYGISAWKAHRWVATAYALESLPRLSAAFARGELGIDKVVELTRFATSETEADLIRWAKDVSCGAIRHRGDLAARSTIEDVVAVERSRSVSWWYFDEGRRFGLELELPAAQGPSVVQAIEREAQLIPAMPGEPADRGASERRADAFVALCSSRIARDADPDRATVVVHAPIEAVNGAANAEAEGGSVIPPQTLRRLLCNARIQTVIEDRSGNALGLGRMTREPSAWMIRQVRYRDRGCRFPGCGARAFTEAHHVRWWRHGGRTDLDNLVLICLFHHRLVHEHGWSMKRGDDGTLRWFTRDGTRYRAGPSTGAVAEDERQRTAIAV